MIKEHPGTKGSRGTHLPLLLLLDPDDTNDRTVLRPITHSARFTEVPSKTAFRFVSQGDGSGVKPLTHKQKDLSVSPQIPPKNAT